MRSVGVVTVARSDYGIYRSVLRRLAETEDIEVWLYVGGMHLVERFGLTVEEIERDGYPIAACVPFLDEDDSPAGIARALGRGVVGFANAFEAARPDLLLVLGDRYEMFAAALAALPLSLPLAHIHGGESTEGLIDEAIRHSMTKLSHLHFASTEVYARRIVQLGEAPWRVTVSGAPALDSLIGFQPLSDEQMAQRGVVFRGPTLLVTYHPLTLDPSQTDSELGAVLEAVAASRLAAVVTYPGADTGHQLVIEKLQRLADSSPAVTLVPNLGTEAYFTLMSRAAAMVGNSSSGIIEAASFELPVIDVGRRQQGRLRPPNVIHAESHADEIAAAIARAVSGDFRDSLRGLRNPYGDGRAGERIAERLSTVELGERLLVKRFHDPRR